MGWGMLALWCLFFRSRAYQISPWVKVIMGPLVRRSMSIVKSESQIWSFWILRIRPCPCQYSTHLYVICHHFIKCYVAVSRPFCLLEAPCKESTPVLDSGIHAMYSRFQVMDTSLCQWNLDSGIQSLAGFRIPYVVFWIPKTRILDSSSRILPESRLHKQKFTGFWKYADSLTRGYP